MAKSQKPSPAASYTIHIEAEEMARRGKIGAHTLHSRHDSRELTAPAREAFLRKFETEVDPDETLPPEERERRATHARKAYFARLALASVRARKARTKSHPENAGLVAAR